MSAMLPNIHQNKVDLQSDASASQALLRTWHRSHSVSLSTVSNATWLQNLHLVGALLWKEILVFLYLYGCILRVYVGPIVPTL